MGREDTVRTVFPPTGALRAAGLWPARFGTLNTSVTGLATVTLGDGDAAGFVRDGPLNL